MESSVVTMHYSIQTARRQYVAEIEGSYRHSGEFSSYNALLDTDGAQAVRG